MNMLQRLVILAGMVTIAGCAATDSRAVEVEKVIEQPSSDVGGFFMRPPFQVILNVIQNELRVVNEHPSAGCDRFSENARFGCIVGPRNEAVQIDVSLVGSPGWHLDAFQICSNNGQQPKPNFEPEEGQTVCSRPLTSNERADWLVLSGGNFALPNEDGRVDISTLGKELTTFEIRDMNWTKASYFYGVRACKNVDKNDCRWTDPGGENNGRGWVSGSN